MLKKIWKALVLMVAIGTLFAMSLTVSAVTNEDPLQIVDVERVDGSTMIVRFNKAVVLDAPNIFSWFGRDEGVDATSGNLKLAMWYGTSNNTLVEDDTALKIVFDEGVVDLFFSRHQGGQEGSFVLAFHQNYDGVLSTKRFETLEYTMVDLWTGDAFVGILQYCNYIPLSEFSESGWSGKVEVETVVTTEPPTDATEDTEVQTVGSTDPQATEASGTVNGGETTAAEVTTGGSSSTKPEAGVPAWVWIIVAAAAVVVVVVVVVKKNKK